MTIAPHSRKTLSDKTTFLAPSSLQSSTRVSLHSITSRPMSKRGFARLAVEKTPPAWENWPCPPGQAGSARKLRCPLLAARTDGRPHRQTADSTCWRPEADGPGGYKESHRTFDVGSALRPGHLSVQQRALCHHSWGQGKRARSARKLVSHNTWKTKRHRSCLQTQFALHMV